MHLLRRKIAGPDVEQLLFANCNFDGLVAPEYLLEYVAILLLRGVGHDYPRSLPSPSHSLTLLTKLAEEGEGG